MRAPGRYYNLIAIVALALCLAPCGAYATKSTPPVFPGAKASMMPSAQAQYLTSDLDGDRVPDRAALYATGRHRDIQIQFGVFSPSGPSSSSTWMRFGFETTAPDRGRLLSADVDHDRDLDLVWVSRDCPGASVVWLGDGRGHFERVAEVEYADAIRDVIGSTPAADLTPGTNDSILQASTSAPSFAFNQESRTAFPARKAELPIHHRTSLQGAAHGSTLAERGPPLHLPS